MILFFQIFRIPPLYLIMIDSYMLRLLRGLVELGLCEVQLLPYLSEILLYLLLLHDNSSNLLGLHRHLQLVTQPPSLVLPPPRLLLGNKQLLSGSPEGKV